MEVQAPRSQLNSVPNRKVCSFWLAGRCNRNPCRFLHARMPLAQIAEPNQPRTSRKSRRTWKRKAESSTGSCSTVSARPPSKTGTSRKRTSISKSPAQSPSKTGEFHKKHCISEFPTEAPSEIDDSHYKNLCESPIQPSRNTEGSLDEKSIWTSSNMVCRDWIDGNCLHGDQCEFLHKWSFGKGFSLVTKLQGHENAITGVAASPSSNKLVTVGKDKTLRIWDGNNGQCLNLEIFDDEIACMAAKGSFIFMGMQNTIKGWDTQNNLRISLSGSPYKVNVIAVEGDKIFAGTENGSILVWKANASGYLEISEPLMGHKDAVVCIRIGEGGRRMFSGSRDNTIRAWDLNNMECMETLYGHTSTVTSLLCWETYLLSSSSDGTTKAWASNENGNIEVVYTHEEGHGVITMEGINIYDPEKKPILLVSCDDSCVRLYELPSFKERGKLFSKKEVCAIERIEVEGSQIFFFTGDASVWRWCPLLIWHMGNSGMSPCRRDSRFTFLLQVSLGGNSNNSYCK